MREQLIGLLGTATFEEVRQRYSATVEKMELQGVGRRTASREIAWNSVESQRLSTLIDYATLAPFAIDCLEMCQRFLEMSPIYVQ